MIIKIEIKTVHEIPTAYSLAIQKYKGYKDEKENCDDIWDGVIELQRLEFQTNFRREEYVCVFEVTG